MENTHFSQIEDGAEWLDYLICEINSFTAAEDIYMQIAQTAADEAVANNPITHIGTSTYPLLNGNPEVWRMPCGEIFEKRTFLVLLTVRPRFSII
jgi:hypothetical protein